MSDLDQLLDELGVEVKKSGNEINGRCPVHVRYKGRESSRYSWYMNSETGLWHCFTCGARGNLPSLVADLTGDPKALLRVHKFMVSTGLERIDREEEEHEAPPPDWMQFAQFEKLPRPICEARKLNPQMATRYGLRFDRERRFVITPVLDPLGRLMGWQGKQGKFFQNEPEGLEKSETLFGINFAKRGSTGLLVESPLDVVRFHSVYDGDDIFAVSSFGASVSNVQVGMLRATFDKLIVALDNDGAGRAESRRLIGKTGKPPIKHLTGFRGRVWWWQYEGDAKDIGEMTDEQILTGLDNITRRVP